MSKSIPRQIASLLNAQNRLASRMTHKDVAAHKREYLVRKDTQGNVAGCCRSYRVSWYQWEVCHLSVRDDCRRQGLGDSLVAEAEEQAVKAGARIVQCTVRRGNEASELLFTKRGYFRGAVFHNHWTGNDVAVWYKPLPPLEDAET